MACDAPRFRRGLDLHRSGGGCRHGRRPGLSDPELFPAGSPGAYISGDFGHHAYRLGGGSRVGAVGTCPVSLPPGWPDVSTSHSTEPPVVEFRNVTVRFGSFSALHDVSFAIENVPQRGEFVS